MQAHFRTALRHLHSSPLTSDERGIIEKNGHAHGSRSACHLGCRTAQHRNAAQRRCARRQGRTTVALDYSAIELDGGEVLHVYGVPGQHYRELMWPMVCEGALGVIVVGQGTVLQVSTIQTGESRIWCGLAPRQTERRESRIGHPRVDGSHPYHGPRGRESRRTALMFPVDAKRPAQSAGLFAETPVSKAFRGLQGGAAYPNRTDDLLFTRQLLYQLS